MWVWTPLRQGVLDTTLCDKVCQWLGTGQWFSPCTPVSFSNKTDSHDITEIFLKVELNTINPNQTNPFVSLCLQSYQKFKRIATISYSFNRTVFSTPGQGPCEIMTSPCIWPYISFHNLILSSRIGSPYDFSNDDVSVLFHFTQLILCSNTYIKLTKYLFSIKTQHCGIIMGSAHQRSAAKLVYLLNINKIDCPKCTSELVAADSNKINLQGYKISIKINNHN